MNPLLTTSEISLTSSTSHRINDKTKSTEETTSRISQAAFEALKIVGVVVAGVLFPVTIPLWTLYKECTTNTKTNEESAKNFTYDENEYIIIIDDSSTTSTNDTNKVDTAVLLNPSRETLTPPVVSKAVSVDTTNETSRSGTPEESLTNDSGSSSAASSSPSTKPSNSYTSPNNLFSNSNSSSTEEADFLKNAEAFFKTEENQSPQSLIISETEEADFLKSTKAFFETEENQSTQPLIIGELKAESHPELLTIQQFHLEFPSKSQISSSTESPVQDKQPPNLNVSNNQRHTASANPQSEQVTTNIFHAPQSPPNYSNSSSNASNPQTTKQQGTWPDSRKYSWKSLFSSKQAENTEPNLWAGPGELFENAANHSTRNSGTYTYPEEEGLQYLNDHFEGPKGATS